MNNPQVKDKLAKPYILFLTVITVYCIFSFKFNLYATAGSGVRFDDILILFAFIIVVTHKLMSNNLTLGPTIPPLMLFVLWSIVSVIINSANDKISFLEGLLYSIRLIEYAVFFFIGAYFSLHNVNIRNIFQIYLLYLAALVLLQMTGMVGVVSDFSTDRAIGNLGGPYELAVVSSFLLFLFWFKYHDKLLSIVALSLIIATASRSTIVAVAIVMFVYWIFDNGRINMNKVICSGVLVSLFYFVLDAFLASDSEVFFISRLLTFFNSDTIDAWSKIYDDIYVASDRLEYYLNTLSEESISQITNFGGDTSAMIRFSRWATLVKTTCSDELSLVFGLGPSFASSAVDGYFVRVFAETGAVGILFFLNYIYKFSTVVKNHKVLLPYICILIMTALFIDIFVTYKPMILLWLLFGYEFQCVGLNNRQTFDTRGVQS